MKKNDYGRKKEKTFQELLEEFLPPKTHPQYQQWKEFNINAVERGQLIIKKIELYVDINGKKCLDLGCGTGGISVAFAKSGGNIVSIDSKDTHPLLLKIARARAKEEKVGLQIVCADGQKSPFHDEVFDIIICNDVIEHVSKPPQLAKEISRLLKPNGILYLTAPNKFSLLSIYRDQHYELFGVILLPRVLAKIYVTKIRKMEARYTVGYIPTYRYLKRMFGNVGITLGNDLMDKRSDEVFNNIDEIKNKKYKNIAVLLDRLKLMRVIRWLFSSSLLRPSLIFIGKKVK